MIRAMNLIMGNRGSKKGSFVIEYTVLVVLIILALVAMRLYLKNAICGRLRSAGDSFGQGRQYEKGVTTVTTNRQ
ncbi:hypothetical protein ACFL2J_00280 [Candidatus Omnitrophota bacterium]